MSRKTDQQQELNSRISTLLMQAHTTMVTRKAAVLGGFDLTITQYVAMLWLRCNPGSSNAQVARWCGISPQSTSTLLTVLEERGLVARSPSTSHARVVAARLTRQGSALLRRADRAALQIDRLYDDAFTIEEAGALRELLARAREALSD